MNVRLARIGLAAGVALCVNGALLLVLVVLNRPAPASSSQHELSDVPVPVVLRDPVTAPLSPDRPAAEPSPDYHIRPPEQLAPVFEAPTLEPLAVIDVPALPAVAVPDSLPASEPGVAAAGESEPSSTEILDAEGIDSAPRELTRQQPHYPPAARQLGREGEVKLKLLIDAEGRVEQVQVLDVIGHHSFERAVMAVAKQWKFSPPLHQGRPVRVWAVKTIRFELKD